MPDTKAMSVALKNFLLITLKNAINAVLTSSALMALNWGAFNFTSKLGWWNLGKVCLSVIGAREATVWLPILLKWSTTSSNPAAIEIPTIPPGGAGGMYVPPQKPEAKP
jgi:hypothetical protein